VPHLPLEECPPLADYDWAPHLIKKSFPVGPVPVNPKFDADPCGLVLRPPFWDREDPHVLGPHESVPQGVHYAGLPHGFQGELTRSRSKSPPQSSRIDFRWIHEPRCRQSPSHVGILVKPYGFY